MINRILLFLIFLVGCGGSSEKANQGNPAEVDTTVDGGVNSPPIEKPDSIDMGVVSQPDLSVLPDMTPMVDMTPTCAMPGTHIPTDIPGVSYPDGAGFCCDPPPNSPISYNGQPTVREAAYAGIPNGGNVCAWMYWYSHDHECINSGSGYYIGGPTYSCVQ